MNLSEEITAIAPLLRPLPNSPEFENAVAFLYREGLPYLDLPTGSECDRIEELKLRLQLYLSYEAMETIGSCPVSWQEDLSVCAGSPEFLSSTNCEIMINRIKLFAFESPLSLPAKM